MAEISAAVVKSLREKTGAGMMECKKALSDADGDMEKAIKLLRERGIAKAEKRTGRTAQQGIIHSYIHFDGRIGVLLELNCETDFVARTDQFRNLANDLALQVAANPQTRCVSREELPSSAVEEEKEIIRKQSEGSGKPPQVIEKMLEGRIEKFYQEVCLMDQPYFRDDKKKISDLVNEARSQTGENIVVRRFVRYHLGEEIN